MSTENLLAVSVLLKNGKRRAQNIVQEEQLSATAGSSRFPSVEEFPSNFRLSMRKKQEGVDNNAGDVCVFWYFLGTFE